METPKIFEKEYRFCLILWEHEPISRVDLAKLCEEQLGWKTTTTYTVVKRLCDRGIFQNDGGTVTSNISREEFYARQSEEYVRESFRGSLPAFLAAFGSRSKLTEQEIDELQRLIDEMRG